MDGDSHNLVAIAMREHGLDVQGAMDYCGQEYHKLREKFFGNIQDLPSWSPKIDAELKEYVQGLGVWVTGNMYWSFESERYLGPKGLEIKEHRFINLDARE